MPRALRSSRSRPHRSATPHGRARSRRRTGKVLGQELPDCVLDCRVLGHVPRSRKGVAPPEKPRSLYHRIQTCPLDGGVVARVRRRTYLNRRVRYRGNLCACRTGVEGAASGDGRRAATPRPRRHRPLSRRALRDGQSRLAIVDLVAGDQPLATEDGRYWVMQNGEIYNWIELRQELRALGHRFTTTSDTEVIAHAYEEWGAECLSRLNGDFAIAVWDRNSRSSSSRATGSASARCSSPSRAATSRSPPRRRRSCGIQRRAASSIPPGSSRASRPGRICPSARPSPAHPRTRAGALSRPAGRRAH